MISQPPSVAQSKLENYEYLAEEEFGITVYIMDTGANPSHPIGALFLVLD